MRSGGSSSLYAGICNVWSLSATNVRETGIAHGLEKYPLFSIRWKPLQKSIKKMTIGLMLLLFDQSCISGNQETEGKCFWSHLCC